MSYFNIDSWRSEWDIENEILLIGLSDMFQNRRYLLGILKNCAFLFKILLFSPNFMAQFAKELGLLICFPYLIPTWSARLSGKKIPESFLTSVTDQLESWGIWDFEIIFTESQWFCSYYIYYLLSTWLVIMSVRIKIISSEFLEQISTDRMIFC